VSSFAGLSGTMADRPHAMTWNGWRARCRSFQNENASIWTDGARAWSRLYAITPETASSAALGDRDRSRILVFAGWLDNRPNWPRSLAFDGGAARHADGRFAWRLSRSGTPRRGAAFRQFRFACWNERERIFCCAATRWASARSIFIAAEPDASPPP